MGQPSSTQMMLTALLLADWSRARHGEEGDAMTSANVIQYLPMLYVCNTIDRTHLNVNNVLYNHYFFKRNPYSSTIDTGYKLEP